MTKARAILRTDYTVIYSHFIRISFAVFLCRYCSIYKESCIASANFERLHPLWYDESGLFNMPVLCDLMLSRSSFDLRPTEWHFCLALQFTQQDDSCFLTVSRPPTNIMIPF